MNLEILLERTQYLQTGNKLREYVKKDSAGNAKEGDVVTALGYLRAIIDRINKVTSRQREVTRYLADISEYIVALEKRGIKLTEDDLDKKRRE